MCIWFDLEVLINEMVAMIHCFSGNIFALVRGKLMDYSDNTILNCLSICVFEHLNMLRTALYGW